MLPLLLTTKAVKLSILLPGLFSLISNKRAAESRSDDAVGLPPPPTVYDNDDGQMTLFTPPALVGRGVCKRHF